MKKYLPLVVALLLVAALGFTGCGASKDTIRITHKDYTEQRLTGQLMSVYLESKGYKTEVTELSGTMLCYTALKNKNVDLYPEFTGSAYGDIFDQTEIIGVQETYDYVKKRCEEEDGITWLKPLGWNNTYVFSMRPETAEALNIETISDLVPHAPEMIMGCDDEFLLRMDGLPGLKEAYPGLAFKEEVSMDQGLTYAALRDKKIDINVSYSTDGRIAKFGLVNIKDDKGFFPPYYVTPILRMDYAEKHPDVVEALNELGGHWNEEDMKQYNYQVDEGAKVRDVATEMLKDKGLIE